MDEAELLPYRALKVLHPIHDRSGVAIVLEGMPRLLINLKASRGKFAQLYSRVGMALDLEAHKGESEVDDFNTVLGSLLPEEDGKSLITLLSVAEAFLKHLKGNYHGMFKLTRGVVRARTEV